MHALNTTESLPTEYCFCLQDASFQQARAKTAEAEKAARTAQENADKAIRLLKISEESSRQVEEYRKEHELKLQKLEELAATVSHNPPPPRLRAHPYPKRENSMSAPLLNPHSGP